MGTTAFLLAFLALSAASTPREATEQEIVAVKTSLETKLFDAQSARFSAAHIVEEGTVGHLCVMVNAKNRLGAYVGYKAVYAIMVGKKDGRFTGAIATTSTDGTVQREMCEQHGVPLP